MRAMAAIASTRGRFGLGLTIAFVAFVLDQASKMAILASFRPPGMEETPFFSPDRVTVLPVLDFVLTWNRGVSFGMGNNGGTYNVAIFTALALVIGAGLVRWMARAGQRWVLVALGLVLGGAVGNVLDRLRFGAVVDFLYVHVGAFNWWPIFNIADCAVCVGAAILVFDSLFARRDSNMNTQ